MKCIKILLLSFCLLLISAVPAFAFIIPVQNSGVSTYYSWGHPGIDLMTDCNVPIYASKYGTVATGWEDYGYGNYITIDSDSDHQIYGHLSSFAVWSGWVETGQLIGYTGNTGRSYGCHLHYEVWWQGQSVDPLIPFPDPL